MYNISTHFIEYEHTGGFSNTSILEMLNHYSDVIMDPIASQITRLFTVYAGAGERKHQRSASLAFVRGIHRWPVNSPHKGPVTRNMFPFDDVIMHWNGMSSFWRYSSEVVRMKTFSAASDENFTKITTFPFQWIYVKQEFATTNIWDI